MSSRTSFTILREIFPLIDERIIKAVILEHGDDIDSALEFILNEAIPKQSAQIVTEKFDHSSGSVDNLPAKLNEAIPKQSAQIVTENFDHRCGSVDNLLSKTEFWVDSKQQSHDDDTPELFDEIILAGKNPITFDGDVDGSSLSVNLLTDGKAYNEVKVNSPSPSETAHLHKQFYGETCDGDYSLSGESNISQSGAEIENMQLTGTQSSKKNSADIEDLGFYNFSFKEKTDEISSKGMSSGSSMCDSESSMGQLRGITNASSHEGENQSMREMLFGGIRSISLLPAYNETIRCFDAEPIISLDASDSADKRYMNNLPVSQSIGDSIDYLSVYNKENSIYMELDTRDSFSSAQSSILSCNGSSSSCQIVDTNSLEGVVAEAKKNKEVLMEGMESIRSLWTKIHCEESAARHAKEEAAKGGLETLAKVEELRQTLARAKETNDMHAGEVYGERAILATEARELRSRIAQLAAEKDSALCMIKEMCGALQARYDAARKERETALEEKMKKEETARKVLEMEESVMTKVAQDSRDLELEAETNTKLREFLIDRGHSVDSLQGELSVLYQDVKVLKEQIDGGIATVANGYLNIKLAASPGREDCKSFSGSDDIDASRSMLYSSHESRDAQFVCNSLHDSIENMKTLSPVASCEQLVNFVPNTVDLLADGLVDHFANGGERSRAEADTECHDESLQSLNYSGEARKEYSFEQLSDDGWQMLETDNDGFRKAVSDSFPSLSFLGKTKSKQS